MPEEILYQLVSAPAEHLTRCISAERDSEGNAADLLLGFVAPARLC